jgi:hypothetical protein
MKYYSLAVISVIAAATLMCTPKPEPEKTEKKPEPVVQDSININIPDLVSNRKDLFLSDIATQVTYVPLETTSKFLIGEKSVHVKPCAEFIFVSEHGKPVGVFSRNGRFIRTIGKIGEGPGEYNSDFNFWPDSTTRQIYIWNAIQGSIMAFSFEGEHRTDIKPEKRFGSFAPLGNNRFLTWTFLQQEFEGKYYRLYILDEQGKILTRFFEPQRTVDLRGGIMTPLMTPTRGGFLYNTWEDDRICRITGEGLMSSALSWDPGSLKMPVDGIKDYARFLREKDNYVLDISGCETGTAWYLKFYFKGRMQMSVCSKTDDPAFMVANPDTARLGVFNDFDGGPSFWPMWDNEGGREFVGLINAMELIEVTGKSGSGMIPAKFPDKAAALKQLVSSLDENSNPVVMLVELR